MKEEVPKTDMYKSRERIGLFVADNVDAMLAYWDKDQVCRFANNAYRQWFGKASENIVNKTMSELLGPLYQINLPYISGVLAGRPQKFEREMQLPAGVTKFSLASYHPDIVDGEVIGFFVHVADVTDIKRLERELAQTNEIARIGSWEIEVKTQKPIWSKVTRAIHEVPDDYEPDLATAINFFKEGKSRASLTAAVEKAMKDGTHYDLEVELVTARGNEKWTRAIGKAEFKDGECIRLFGTFQDIDAGKKIQEELSASEKSYREVSQRLILATHSASVGIWDYDVTNNVLVWDDTLYHLYGITRDTFAGEYEAWKGTLHPDDLTSANESVQTAIREMKSFDTEFRIIRPDGSIRNIKSKASVNADNKGHIRMIGVSWDMTDQKNAEESLRKYNELEVKNKEMEQFVYVASHDLREPLVSISAFADMLQQQYQDKLDKEGVVYLNYIVQSASRMTMLIKGLLDYSRIGKERYLERVDTKEIIEGVIVDLDGKIKESNAVIEVRDLPEIDAYRSELQVLFQNLISNAIKFRKKGVAPLIKISAKRTSGKWLFQVKDNGIGVKEGDKDFIFIIFKRLHNRSEVEGDGIGLAHCKKIVEMLNGQIWVESVPELGSTFYFTLSA